MKQHLCVFTSLFFCVLVNAQDFHSYRHQQQESFQQYKQKTQEEFEAYRRKVNAEFAEFLGKPWESIQGEKPVSEPRKPDIPPVVMPEIGVDIPEDKPIDVNINFPRLDAEPRPIAPVPYQPKPAEKTLSFTFYGTPGSVRFDTAQKAHLKGADEKAVSAFWKELSGPAYDNVVADCQSIRKDLDLCDWAYFKALEKVSETLYESRNERTVFLAWLLTQSGFSMRLGRDKANLYLLLGTTDMLFEKLFWKLEDGVYSLMGEERVTSLKMVNMTFPETSPLRMRMPALNTFAESVSAGRNLKSKKYPDAAAFVSCDKNRLAFYEDFPSPAIGGTGNTNFMAYADMPLSESARKNLYRRLFEQVTGKTEAEAANILLNFVQTAFDYKTDGEVWGRERTFFPEETLYYPYCDCEDRSILFSRLVRDIMGLESAFVLYPGHLATAVHFTTDIPGDYFIIGDKRYLVCDPTYINASIGRTMPGMDNTTAQVYVWE